MKPSRIKFFHWTPGILCIAAILFTSLFAFDTFSEELPLKEQIIGFVMHLIPQFILIIILIFAWRFELLGGILFTLIGIVFSVVIFIQNYEMNEYPGWAFLSVAIITLPFLISGVLFIVSYYFKKIKDA